MTNPPSPKASYHVLGHFFDFHVLFIILFTTYKQEHMTKPPQPKTASQVLGFYASLHFLQTMTYTGSFRKNGKSKTVFMGTKFDKNLIFSAFFSRELATSLRSWATRFVTITEHCASALCPRWTSSLRLMHLRFGLKGGYRKIFLFFHKSRWA